MEGKSVLFLDEAAKEPAPFDTSDPFNLRVINVTVGTQQGVWSEVEKMRSHLYTKIQCWETRSRQAISFDADPMGYIVENNVLEEATNTVLSRAHNVETRRGERVAKLTLPQDDLGGLVSLDLESGESHTASLVVGADGANSMVRRTLDVPVVSWQYGQHGVVCVLQGDPGTSPMDTAYQRFLPGGPIALLPLGNGGLYSLVWSCSTAMAQELTEMEGEEFVSRVNAALHAEPRSSGVIAAMDNIWEELGLLHETPHSPNITELVGPRAKFPLGFSNSARYVGPRVALVGDAAHRVHPLAGQGANIGYRGVRELVNAIESSHGLDIGDYRVLNKYETKQQRLAVPMLVFIDAIQRLYGVSAEPVVALRSKGVGIINLMKPLKHVFMEGARS
eukprot:sb/3465516/